MMASFRAGAAIASRTKLHALIALAAVGLAAPAAAQDICAGLKQAVAHAAQNFQALRAGPARSEGTHTYYAARRLFAGAGKCEIDERNRGFIVDYRCDQTRLGALPRSQVISEFQRTAGIMRRCFAGVEPQTHGDPNDPRGIIASVDWLPAPDVRVSVTIVKASDEDAGRIDNVSIRVRKQNRRRR